MADKDFTSDRELLEMAARAAGIKITWSICGMGYEQGPWVGNRGWRPLADDGDALRLAADLDLFGDPSYWHYLSIARLEGCTDKHANVRRAIVRAAAAIGAAL